MLSHSSTQCHVPCLVPTPGMESTFQEYQSFSDSVVVSEENLPAYTRAKKRLEGYLPFENQLVSDTVEFQLPCSQSLPQHLTSLVPKQLACFVFFMRVCVCVFGLFVVCLFVCLFVLQEMKSWAGVWEHGQWNLSSTDPCPQAFPLSSFGSLVWERGWVR